MIRNYICSQLMQMGYQIISDQLAILAGVTADSSLGTRIPRHFFLFCRGCHGPTDRVGEKFSYYHIVAKGETLASIAEGYLGRDGSQQVGAIINANPWLKDLDQSVASESRLHSWGRVIKDWDWTQSDVPENLLLNIFNVMLEN